MIAGLWHFPRHQNSQLGPTFWLLARKVYEGSMRICNITAICPTLPKKAAVVILHATNAMVLNTSPSFEFLVTRPKTNRNALLKLLSSAQAWLMVNVTIDVILLPPPSPKQPHGFERMGSKLLPASLSEKKGSRTSIPREGHPKSARVLTFSAAAYQENTQVT